MLTRVSIPLGIISCISFGTVGMGGSERSCSRVWAWSDIFLTWPFDGIIGRRTGGIPRTFRCRWRPPLLFVLVILIVPVTMLVPHIPLARHCSGIEGWGRRLRWRSRMLMLVVVHSRSFFGFLFLWLPQHSFQLRLHNAELCLHGTQLGLRCIQLGLHCIQNLHYDGSECR